MPGRGAPGRRAAGHRAGDLADGESAGRPAAPRRTGCCRRAGCARRAWAGTRARGRASDQACAGRGSRAGRRGCRRRAPLLPPREARPPVPRVPPACGGLGRRRLLGRGLRRGAPLAGEPLPSALTFSAAGFAPPNDSRSRRATGASTVEDADLTNSPCSLSRARTSLLVTPSSFANSCTRALPATTSPV